MKQPPEQIRAQVVSCLEQAGRNDLAVCVAGSAQASVRQAIRHVKDAATVLSRAKRDISQQLEQLGSGKVVEFLGQHRHVDTVTSRMVANLEDVQEDLDELDQALTTGRLR